MFKFLKFLLIFCLLYIFFNLYSIVQATNDSEIEPVKPDIKLGCYGINVTNLTKNLTCNNSNPNDCNVQKGDKLKITINSDKAKSYYFWVLKIYSDGKSFVEPILYSNYNENINEHLITVDDYNGLIRYEIKGYVNNIPYFSNSSKQCAVTFKLTEFGNNEHNISTSSCVDTKLLVNENVCKSRDCFVEDIRNFNLKLTVQALKKPLDIFGYAEYIFTDGTSFDKLWTSSSFKEEENNKFSIDYKHDVKFNDFFNYFNVELAELKISIYLVDQLDDNNSNPYNNFLINTNYLNCIRSIKPLKSNTLSLEDRILIMTLNDNLDGKFNIFNKLNDKEFFVNVNVKNVSDFDIDLKDLDFIIKYDRDLLNLNKVVLKKGNNQFEFNNLSTNNIKDLKDFVDDPSFSELKSNETYNVYYYFEINDLTKTNYCLDFISEKYSQNFNNCFDLSYKKDTFSFYLFLVLLIVIFVVMLTLSSVVFMYIYRNKVINFIKNFFK